MVDTVLCGHSQRVPCWRRWRTAYEQITSHAYTLAQIGFAEVVDFKLETDKSDINQSDIECNEGMFLGYDAWRSTEYLIAAKWG